MVVTYTRSMIDEVRSELYKARAASKEIEYITMTSAEWSKLIEEFKVMCNPVNVPELIDSGRGYYSYKLFDTEVRVKGAS